MNGLRLLLLVLLSRTGIGAALYLREIAEYR